MKITRSRDFLDARLLFRRRLLLARLLINEIINRNAIPSLRTLFPYPRLPDRSYGSFSLLTVRLRRDLSKRRVHGFLRAGGERTNASE